MAIKVMAEKKPKVVNNNSRASFFLPSTYHIAGRPKTRKPVKAAEMTNNISRATGARKELERPN
jgi:hypothetical protein